MKHLLLLFTTTLFFCQSGFSYSSLIEPLLNSSTMSIVQTRSDSLHKTTLTLNSSGQFAVVFFANSTLGYINAKTGDMLRCFPFRYKDHLGVGDITTALLDCEKTGNISQIPSGAQYGNGNRLKEGDNLYHENGYTLYSSGNWYYSTGNSLNYSGTFYWESGYRIVSTTASFQFPNGNTISNSSYTYYPNGQRFSFSGNLYYANGSSLKSSSTYYYPTQSIIQYSSGSNIYYEGGQTYYSSINGYKWEQGATLATPRTFSVSNTNGKAYITKASDGVSDLLIFDILIADSGYNSSYLHKTVLVPAPTCTITASKAIVKYGESVTLNLVTSGVKTAATLDGTTVAATGGSKTVIPNSVKTYTATVTGPGGTNECSVKVDYEALACSITASQYSVTQGQSVTLSMTTKGVVSSATLNNVSIPKAGGSVSVTPSATTIYQGSVTGPEGTKTCSNTVTVNSTGTTTQSIYCASPQGRYVECPANSKIKAAVVTRKDSYAACTLNSSFGWKPNTNILWVKNGCRAMFSVTVE